MVLLFLFLLTPAGRADSRIAEASRRGESEQAVAGSSALSLEDAWRIALENNLTLQQQEKLVSQAREELAIQKAQYLPSLSSLATYGYTSEVARFRVPITFPGIAPVEITAGTKDRYDLAAQIDQPLFTGFRTRNLVRSAAEQFHAQSAQKDATLNQVRLQIGLLYFQIQLDYLQQQVLEQAIERADRHLDIARSFFRAEQTTAFDTLEVANRKLQLQSQLAKLRDLHPVLVSRLVHLLSIDYTPEIPELSVENPNLLLDDLDDYEGTAALNRPELKQIRFAQSGQSFRVKALQSSYFPQLYASASYHHARPGVNFFEDAWMDYYTLGLSLRWQLWNWKQDQRQVKKARLDYERLDLQSRQLVLDVSQQVTEAFQQLQTVKQQIDLQRRLAAQERERYRITKDKFQQGLATSLDLSMSENSLASAELTLKQNYVEWLQGLLQLQFATGMIGKEGAPAPGR